MRVSPCAKKSRESVVAETRAFCRNRPREFRFDHSLPNSHHSSFLEGIVLQEPAWPSALRPQPGGRAGRQAGSGYCLLFPPPPPPPPPRQGPGWPSLALPSAPPTWLMGGQVLSLSGPAVPSTSPPFPIQPHFPHVLSFPNQPWTHFMGPKFSQLLARGTQVNPYCYP